MAPWSSLQAAIAIENSYLYKKIQEEAVIRDKFYRFFPQSVSKKLREEGNLEIVETEVTAGWNFNFSKHVWQA